MFLITYFFAITKDTVLFKIYLKSLVFSEQNAVVLSFEIVSDIKAQYNTSFYRLDLVPSFSNYQNMSMLWFHFYYFFRFLTATNALATS